MKSQRIGIVIVCIAADVIFLIGAYFYSQQLASCDRAGGIIVRSGINNICIDRGDVVDTDG